MRPLLLDVRQAPYRARGDGLTDDGPAIQAAIDDAAAAGGGVVYLPAGTYQLASMHEQPGIRYYLLNTFSGVRIVGDGPDLTLLRAPAGMPDQARIISADSADGRSRVSGAGFYDFAIDGNAGNQPDARSCVGISNVYTEDVVHARVRIFDVKGMDDAEGTCFDSFYSTNNVYRECEVLRRQGPSTGSGFSATHSSGIRYARCRASGSAHWQGFTAYFSHQLDYLDCHGYQNAQRGLNCENSTEVRFVGCLAGGTAIGNRGDGLYVFKSARVEVIDCTSRANQCGLVNIGSTVRVLRGQFVENTAAGLAFGSMEDWQNSSIDENPVLTANGFAAVAVAGRPLG